MHHRRLQRAREIEELVVRSDPTEVLLAVAEANGELLHRSGVRWARERVPGWSVLLR